MINDSIHFIPCLLTVIFIITSCESGDPRTHRHRTTSSTSSPLEREFGQKEPGEKAKNTSCSIQSFEACLSMIKSVTDSEQLAFASTQKDLDKACRKLQRGLNCADDHMKKCVTRGQRQVFEEVVKGTRDVISSLCVSGPVQRNYLRFSGCYKNVSKSADKCAIWVRKIQELDVDIQENIKRDKIDEGLHKFCCTFIQAYECQVNHLRVDCGPEAVEFFEKNLNEMSNSLIHRHCSSFSHRECLTTPDTFVDPSESTSQGQVVSSSYAQLLIPIVFTLPLTLITSHLLHTRSPNDYLP